MQLDSAKEQNKKDDLHITCMAIVIIVIGLAIPVLEINSITLFTIVFQNISAFLVSISLHINARIYVLSLLETNLCAYY